MHAFWCVFAGHPDSRRQKTLMKTETFGNGFKSGFFWKTHRFGVERWKRRLLKTVTKKLTDVIALTVAKFQVPLVLSFSAVSVWKKKHCENADVGRNILLRFRLYEDFWKRSSEFKVFVQNAALIYFRPHYLRQIWAWPQYSLTFAGSPLPLFKRHRPQWR